MEVRQRILIVCFLFLMPVVTQAQVTQNLRSRLVRNDPGGIVLDTLSIIPGSVIIKTLQGEVIPDSLYRLDFAGAKIHGSVSIPDSLEIVYRVFPFNFSTPYSLRKESDFLIPFEKRTQGNRFVPSPYEESPWFGSSQLESRGSLARGISLGNNQDASVTSGLNLQLSGKLSENLTILAAISDKNIPVQPDGYSQQIQDFDRVYIQLYSDRTEALFGDFEILSPQESYFMKIFKKNQGGMIRHSTGGEGRWNYSGSLGGAVSRGRYSRNQFLAREGNQGPYRLQGSENETVIIILAGSEKVYVDGQLQRRGEENDYVIDYNLAEITFTARRPMTKDRRITVEFEYTEKSYARFSVFQSNLLEGGNGRIWLNWFSEQDSKNQPVLQELDDTQRQLLSSIGDSLELAVSPNIKEVEFTADQVLYKKVDTLANNIPYTVYVYSTHPDSARFRLGFSYVGEGKGSYIPVRSEANGKVYRWVAPEGEQLQGDYEPVVRLVTPRSARMLTLGTAREIRTGTRTFFELALSQRDPNTFSKLSRQDHTGYALKMDLEQDLFTQDTARRQMKTRISYQLIDKNFVALERFRPVEFERDWNLQEGPRSHEHLAGISVRYKHPLADLSYAAEYLSRSVLYEGLRQTLSTRYQHKGIGFSLSGSLLNSAIPSLNSLFLRHRSSLSYELGKVRIGIREEAEKNRWQEAETDSLFGASFAFQEWELFLENTDQTENRYSFRYNQRTDLIPFGNELVRGSVAREGGLDVELLSGTIQQVTTGITYRRLNILGPEDNGLEDQETLLGRIQYNLRVLKGSISSTSLYETGSGQEMKKSYAYLEVPQGQGVYRWSDYNNNGIRELDEFDVAAFQDEASYLRVLLPGNESVTVRNLKVSQVLNIQPGRVWKPEKKFPVFLAGFSDHLAFNLNRKSTEDKVFSGLNPFAGNLPDTSLVSMSRVFRNSLSWKKKQLGFEYLYQDQENRIYLLNGFENREQESHALDLKWDLSETFVWLSRVEKGVKKFRSEYFPAKNFTISNLLARSGFRFQPGIRYGLELHYEFSRKTNGEGIERSVIHKTGVRFNRQEPERTTISIEMEYLGIAYNATTTTALSYEMLEGLFTGNNFVWGLNLQHKLVQGIEMNVVYQGRKSKENLASRTVHTASIQARAIF